MSDFGSSTGSTQPYIPVVPSTQIGKYAGLHMIFPILTDGSNDALGSTSLLSAVKQERGNIMLNGVGIWSAGQTFSVATEPVGVKRVWFIGASASLSHARTVMLRPGLFLMLGNDLNTVTATSGAPTGGNPGDLAVDYSGNVFYVNTAGIWAVAGAIYPAAGSGTAAVPITVSGLTAIGSVLTAMVMPNWVNNGGNWIRITNGSTQVINGATALTYTTVTADGGATVTYASSNIPFIPAGIAVAAAAPAPAPAPSPAPSPSPSPSPPPAPGTAPATPAVPSNATVVALAASGDMTDAINNAIAAAPANSCVRFTGTSAHHTYALGNREGAFPVASNVRLHFDVQLVADDEQNSALYFTGAAGLTVSGLNTGVGTLGPRRGSYFAYKATFVNCSNLALYDPVIRNSAAAGIFLDNCNGFTIVRPSVSGTLADGIHATNGSKNGVIYDPQINNPGDDQIAVVSYTQDAAMCDNIIVWRPVTRGQNTSGRGLTVVGGSNIHYYDIDVDGTYGGALCHMCEQNGDFQTQMPINCSFERGTVKNYNQAASLDHGGYFVLNQLANSKMTDLQCKGITFHDTPNNRPVVNAKDDNISGALMGRILCQDITATGLYYQPSPFNADSAIPTAFNTTLQDNGVTFNNCVAVPSVTAPTIAAQPVSQSVSAGSTATFTVVALANGGTLSYQWWGKAGAISAATSASYTTPITATSDSGATFYCVVSNSAGTVTSSTVTLTVTRAAVTVPSGATLVTSLYPQDPDMVLTGNDWGSANGGSPPQAFLNGSSIGIMAGDGFVETIYADTNSSAYIVVKAVGADYNATQGKLAFVYLDNTGGVNSGVNSNDSVIPAGSANVPVPGDHVRWRRAGTTGYTEKQVGGAGAWVLLYTFPVPIVGPVRIDLCSSYDGTKKSRSVAALGVTPITVSNISSIAAVPGKAPIGINWASYGSGDRPNVFVDMVKQGGFLEAPGTGAALTAFDSNGWPTTDFRVQAHLLDDSTVSQDCAFEIGGWADSIAMELNHGRMSILNKVYDAANNKTNFTVRVAAGTHELDASLISFTGTRRTGGSTGAVNTGLSYVKGAHPGYALSDIGAKKFTDEYLAWLRTFKCVRFMDALGVNNDPYLSTWSPPGPTPVGVSLDDMIDLCNAAGVDGWFCTYISYSDAACTAFLSYIDARLSPGLHFYSEFGNEQWNYSLGARASVLLDRASAEVKGFVGQSATRNITFSRASNVVTFTTQVAHGWTAGQPLHLNDSSPLGGTGTPSTVTLLTASGSTATITSPGADTGTTQPGTNFRVSYDLTGTLASWDQFTDNYGLQQRYAIRRQKEISDLARVSLGDAKMQTRCRIVWADQMSNGGNAAIFDYIAGTFTARRVSDYFFGWAGAPYYFANTTATDNNATKAAVVADLNAVAATMKYGNQCAFDSRVIGAGRYGLRALCYEGGPDTTAIFHGEGNSDFSNAALVRNQAQLDPGMKTGVEQMLSDWFAADGDLACWYSGLFIGPTDNSRYQCWAVADTVSNFTAGKMAAFRELGTNGVPVSRNVISVSVGTLSTIDGRLCENNYDTTTANPPTTGNSRRFFVYAPAAGVYDVSVIYSAAYSYNAYLQVNTDPGQYFGSLTVNPGTYPDYSASHETPLKQVYLHAGSNCINLYAGENHGGGDLMWRSLKLTRVS